MQSTAKDLDQDQDFEEFQCHPIDELQNEGVNAADITKLKSAGLCTVGAVVMWFILIDHSPRKELSNIKGMSDAKLDKIMEAAKKIEGGRFFTASDILSRRKMIKHLSTGSSKLDKMLCEVLAHSLVGGVESMSITEVFGEFRTGKTQMAHTLCVTAQLPRSAGGGEGKACYIDTEGTFRPEKITKIAQRFELDPEDVLDNIVVARVFTVDALGSLLVEAAAMMLEEPFSLLVVDSIMAPFRVDYSGRGELAERQQVLGKILNRLQKLSEQFNLAVFLTNQVMADPGGAMSYAADPKRPVGGNILAHASATRLYLKKGRGNMRTCKVYDSPCVPETEEVYELSQAGITDATE